MDEYDNITIENYQEIRIADIIREAPEQTIIVKTENLLLKSILSNTIKISNIS